MRGKGITYETGFINESGTITRESFNAAIVEREMRIIREDLHCNAVRVTGGDADRLEMAARLAANAGLEVWFCPFTCGLTIDEQFDFIVDCAERAERIRQLGAEVVFLTGSEISIFTVGFLPGETLQERLSLFAAPERLREVLTTIPLQINEFLNKVVVLVREKFGGKLSYASLPFEGVDWSPFDIISTDAGYRSAEVADQIIAGTRALLAGGKPVAITEFGCTTYQGAADLGGRGDKIIVWDDAGRPLRLNGNYIRDEAEQAAYIHELLDIYNREGVDYTFVCSFAYYHLPHRSDPQEDLDMASFGIVKVFEDRMGYTYSDMPWEPKMAFATLADYYRG
ncbi:hypothetical protein [Cohnella cellulosilytica]|uniref:Abortive infection protein n=1 Tax=Cohnella cellulosilytica TaxID=986710 RepID=A0ABW2FRP6_9BACL